MRQSCGLSAANLADGVADGACAAPPATVRHRRSLLLAMSGFLLVLRLLLFSPASLAAQSSEGAAAAAAGKKYFREVYQLADHDNRALSVTPADLIQLLGNTEPFSLVPFGSAAVVIYSTNKQPKEDTEELSQLKTNLKALLAKRPTDDQKTNVRATSSEPTSIVIRVPRLPASSDVFPQVRKLDYDGIKVKDAVPGLVRITCESGVNPATYRAFLNNLRRLFWGKSSEGPAARVFYLDATNAAAALGGTPVQSAKANGADASTQPANQTSAKTGGDSAAKPNSDSEGGGGDASSGSAASVQGGDKQKAKNPASKKKPGGGSASGGPAGGGQSGGAAKPNQPGPAASTTKPAAATETPAASAPEATARPATVLPVASGDMVVFSGDDAAIMEKKRILATIDFPRPEVIINAWSFQASSSKAEVPEAQARRLRQKVGQFNEALQRGIERAYIYIHKEILAGAFFDKDFYDYLSLRYVADSPADAPRISDTSIVLSPSENKVVIARSWRRMLGKASPTTTGGVCSEDQYCLGYTTLFNPLRPTLTDMLLAVIASEKPQTQFKKALEEMIGDLPRLNAAQKKKFAAGSCEEQDAITLQASRDQVETPFPLYCFIAELKVAIPSDTEISMLQPLRAALANFLFQYKMAIQYPHEFSPYDLSQSAQDLNSVLNPLVQAFNRDLAAYLGEIATDTATGGQGKRSFLPGGGTRFINNGIITVRTVSGQQTTVDTITQNYFDASSAPALTDVINSIGSAEKNIPGPIKANLSANEAAVIIGALNSVSPTTARIGREFKISVTPHSLSGASASQLEVSLDTNDVSEPTLYSNNKSTPDQTSRIARHGTSTRVRLESIKLFEISAFTAMLQRSRKNLPLVPPFMELPYIGSLVSIPLPGAKEFHRSTAVMSAIVVPTAADLANGIAFVSDRVAACSDEGPGERECQADADSANPKAPNPFRYTFRRALTLEDLGRHPIREFNRAMVKCFGQASSHSTCGDLTFASVEP